MRAVVLVVSAIAVLLGGLWLVQGLGLVEIEPMLCFAECEPIAGPSPTWAIVGFLMVMAGAVGIRRSLKRGAWR